MRLHEADCHLEYARLFLAMGDAAQAREHFAVAKRMVAEMGYGRRDGEVAALEAELGEEAIRSAQDMTTNSGIDRIRYAQWGRRFGSSGRFVVILDEASFRMIWRAD